MIGTTDLLLMGVIAATGGLLLWANRPSGTKSIPPTTTASEPQWPEPTLRVLSFHELVQSTDTTGSLSRIESASGLNAATWQGCMLPVFQNVAELVQLLPASEAHHHAQPGGLWIHTCETVSYALKIRGGVVLPPGREADDVARDRHRWTAGVIVAALLHDVGKAACDVRVRLYGPSCSGAHWSAMAGTMRDAGASDYAVSFPPENERDYHAHQRHGALLLQRLVPPTALVWIGEDRDLLQALVQYLLGEAGPDSPIATIVSRAEGESVRANLLNGPRTRFASAGSVPLIERLMGALRRMLAEGGHLPLNRPGAAGYVYEGEIWFAAARLANAVRGYLTTHESATGIPGEDKNDRLFDAWQDYGACRTNPVTGRALFGGRIELAQPSGSSYELSAMLRFPLDKLYRAPDHYPAPMAGKIAPIAAGKPTARDPAPSAEPTATARQATDAVDKPAATDNTSAAVACDSPPPGVHSVNTPPTHQFLADEDAAKPEQLVQARPAGPKAGVLAPVAPSLQLPGNTSSSKPVPERALQFMQWVQTKVADGSLPYNATGAMVHFVRQGSAMALLLVSPVIFRRYEEDQGSTSDENGGNAGQPGLATQRAFTAAGWHVRAKGGKNITSYQVMRSGDKGGNLLNGFLLLEPERFFDPVPPPNDRLIAWNTAPSGAKEAS